MQNLEKKQTKEEDSKSMGAFEIRERNERGDRLTEFAEERNLIMQIHCSRSKNNNNSNKNKQKREKTNKQQTNKQKQNKTKKDT